MRLSLWITIAVAVVVLLTISSSVYTVNQTQEALITEFGKPIAVIDKPGLHFKTPFVQTVILFDKRLQMDRFPAEETILGDQKRLIVDGFVEYRIVNPLAFYQTVGPVPGAIRRLRRWLRRTKGRPIQGGTKYF